MLSKVKNRLNKITAWITLLTIMSQPFICLAQTTADDKASVNNQAQVSKTTNDVTQVNIVNPDSNGLSHNIYKDFNIDEKGLILNNSFNNIDTQLAGQIQGNSKLTNGSAKIILNEVTGSNISNLNGTLEVAGQRADVIIANPNGIVGNNFTLINTNRAVLTTGVPNFGGSGSLERFRVTKGEIRIEDDGINAVDTEKIDLIARAVVINEDINAKEINIVTGSNDVKYDDLTTTKIAGDVNKPTVGIDVGELGGMYAHKITMVGTEKGVGVVNAGTIETSEGNLTLTNDGKITLKNNVKAKGNINITATDDIDNSGKINSGLSTTIIGKNINNSSELNAGELGSADESNLVLKADEDITLTGSQSANSNINIEAKNIKNNSTKTSANNDINITTLGGNTENIQGEITANGKIKINTNSLNNSQGTISAKQDSEINTTDIDNTQGIINADSAKLVSSNNINNHQGNIKAGNGLEITAKNISNSYGNINNIFNNDIKLTTQELLNDNGNITSNNNIQTQADKVTNTGLIEAKNDNSIKVKNEFINAGTIKSGNNTTFEEKVTTLTNNGNIISGQNTNIKATTISNSGKVSAKEINIDGETLTNEGEVSATANNNINLTKDLTNTENGIVKSFADVNITNVGKANNNGNINAARDVKITAHEILNDTKGSLTAVNEVDLTTNKFENKGSIDSSQTKLNGVIISKVDSQVIADNSVPGQYKPMIDKAANGVDLVQIASASSAGVSRNIYTNLDVKQSGLILNNSVNYTQTELGGYIDGNARLGGVAAKTILNEVTGSNQSNLRGFVEVAGKRANVIIANPNGFSVNGFGFLNAANGSLVTGKTYFDGAGNINYFDIYNKNISVKGFGANADTSDRLDLLAGSANITAGLWSNEINVITGSNQVGYNTLNAVNVLSGNNPNPAIDISSLGGMYANKIRLSSLDKDATITNNGEITAKKDGFTLSSEGKVENTGEIYVKGNTTATVNDSMTNDGIILTEKETKLYVKDDLKNIDGGVIYSKGSITIAANENLDANNNPTVGSKSVLNQSSTIETDGTLKIKADKITNEKTKFVADWDVTKKNYAFGIRPLPNHYAATRRYNETIQVGDIKEETDQSYLIAGENMLLDGDLDNKYSSIISGNDLDIKSSLINNFGYQNTIITTDVGTDYHYWRVDHHGRWHFHCWTEYGTTYIPYYKQTTVNIDGTRPGVISAKNNLTVVADTINNITFDAGKDKLTQSDKIISTTNASATKTVLDSKLFTKNNEPTAKYLIETNPQYADYKTFMSSDYLMSRIKADPSKVMKRLGDGAYEQQLIRNQILELTGRVFSSTQTSESDQFKTLMDNGIATAKELKLSVGISLTKEQVAQLTSDMVWMEEKNIEGQNVLVPVVYLAKINKEDVKPNGAFINGKNVTVINSSDLNNIGTIRADENLAIKTNNLNNENALLKANNLIVNVQTTVNNFSSTIYGNNVEIAADGDINNITKVNTNKLGALTQTTANKPSQIIANKDIKITGNNITNQGSSIVAGNNVEINANNDMVNQSIETGERVAVAFRHSKATKESVNNSFSTIQAGKNINVATKGNVVIKGANIEAGDTAVIKADKNIMISAVKDKNLQDAEVGARGSDYFARNKNYDETVKASNVSAKNNLAITSLDTINVTASNINSDQGLADLKAKNNITVETLNEQHESLQEKHVENVGVLSTKTTDTYDQTINNNVVGSYISGNKVNVATDANLKVEGSAVVGTNDVNLIGKENIDIKSAEETIYDKHEKVVKKSGIFSSGGLGFTIGSQKKSDEYTTGVKSQVGSTVGSTDGKVNITSGKDVKIQASDVIAKDDINITGQNVAIQNADNVTNQSEKHEFKQSGLTVSITSPAISMATNVYNTAKGATEVEDNRLKALYAYKAGKDIKEYQNQLNEAKKLKEVPKGTETNTGNVGNNGNTNGVVTGNNTQNGNDQKQDIKQETDSKDTGSNNVTQTDATQGDKSNTTDGKNKTGNTQQQQKPTKSQFSLGLSLGSSKSSSETNSTTNISQGSTIKTEGDLNIKATAGNVDVIGSDLIGKNVTIDASKDINLKAGENKNVSNTQSSSKSVAIGASINLGDGSVSGLNISAGKAKGEIKENGTTYINTNVTASDTLTIKSGQDTTLKGAKATGDKVKADIGGNLNLESQQDKETYDEKNSSAQISLSLDSVQGSVNKGKINSNYQSVTEQTGIYAGKQGFDIKVGKNTDLKGAVIASEADASKNKLSTDTLTYSDIENKAEYSASSVGVNINTSKDAKLNEQGITPNIGMPAKGDGSSTTKSAIAKGTVEIRSNPNQDITGLSRDTNKALNELGKIFDKKTVQEKQELANLFGELAYKEVGDISARYQEKAKEYKYIANKCLEDASKAGMLGDYLKMSQLYEDAKNYESKYNKIMKDWDEGGTMKVALHGLVGGIMSSVSGSGFTSGALGAGANEAIQKKLMNIKDADLHQWASAIIGATATNILGGNVKAGASAAASGTKNNLEAHDIAKQNNEYFWVADNGKHYQFLPGVIQPGTIVKVVDYDGTEHYIIAEDPDFGGNDNYVSEPGYWQSARSMYLRPWTFDSQVSNLVYGGDELKPAYVKAFEIGYNYVDNGVQIVTDATIDGIKVVSDGATKVVDAVGNYGDNITKQSFSEANQQLGNDLIKAADETKAGLTDVTNTAIEKTVSNTNEANIKLQEEVINPIVNDVKTITNEVKDSSYKFYKYEIIPVGQGFTSSIVQNMSYNTVPLEMNNGDNTKMYYIGKTLGDVVCTVGGGVVTLGEAGMTVVASPTGVGVLAGSAATAYTAGATLNSAHNMSNDFNRIFSSKGANSEGTSTAKGDINPFNEAGNLKPNVKYKSGEYNYSYETDEMGRINKFETDNLKLTNREGRLDHNPSTPGKLDGDHAGHLAGDRFGGSPELDNLVSQSSNVNLSQYKKIENQWANALKEGKQVKVKVEVEYAGDSLRPSKFNIKYEIDGDQFIRSIIN